ncbi:MAG: PQQ-binding-like beta-propeller repeat protein [Spirochaetia bacterium]|nr:PQQ-binding-like beta-propeller repeat protein [Spirochaetia bacterium]
MTRHGKVKVKGGLAKIALAALPLLLSPTPAPLAAQPASAAPADAPLAFRFALRGRPVAGPVVARGQVWVVSESRELFVLDEGGRALARRSWDSGAPRFIAPDPFGRALVGTADGRVRMLNRAGGEVWTVKAGGLLSAPPAFGSDGRSFLVAGGRLECRAASGAPLWRAELPGAALLAPAALASGGARSREGVALAVAGGRIAAFDEDGEPRWLVETGAQVAALAAAPPAFTPAAPLVAPAAPDAPAKVALLAALGDGGVLLVRADGAAEKGGRLPFVPVLLEGDAEGWVAAGPAGEIARLDASGTLLWSARTDIGAPHSVGRYGSGAEGRVVVSGSRGAASFDPAGTLMRALAVRGAVGPVVASPAGRVYAGATDWILYSFDFELPFPTSRPDSPAEAAGYAAGARSLLAGDPLWAWDFGDSDALRAGLAELAKTLRSGTIGTEEGYAGAWAAAVGLGLGPAPASPFGGPAPYGPQPIDPLARARACELLGALGSPRATSALAEIWSNDPDQAVRAAAARALGAIGLDPDGAFLSAFAAALDRSVLDEGLALASIDAVEALYRANGSLGDASAALALVRLAAKPYGSAVRSRAAKVLSLLARGP